MKVNSVAEFVDYLISEAICKRASDIHFDATSYGIKVRLRIDGYLTDYKLIKDLALGLQIISRIKVLANLDIAKKRIPQDGKISLGLKNKKIDLRVSTFPSTIGEKVVVRILEKSQKLISLDQLGFNQNNFDQIKKMINKKQGLIIVTGPTGSGKTTTLYSIISLLNSSEKNIITLEDPVEYFIDGITQGQVSPDSGFTFAHGIRSMLRQDPDIIMIGEIRDKESAQIAMEASLTGHLVLTTLHTNDSSSAIVRLLEMGIEPYLLNTSVLGVVAQRLARKICRVCKKQKNCDVCNQGYKGRLGIFELLALDDEIKQYINSNVNLKAIRDFAIKNGMKTLKCDAQDKIDKKLTDLEEILRVLA